MPDRHFLPVLYLSHVTSTSCWTVIAQLESPRSISWWSLTPSSVSDRVAFISFINSTSSTQPKSLVLNNESLGGFFARGFRGQDLVADECSALGSVLRLFDERPVRALDHHRRKKGPNVGRHAQMIPTKGSTHDQIKTGAMVHVASVPWVFFWSAMIRQILATQTLRSISQGQCYSTRSEGKRTNFLRARCPWLLPSATIASATCKLLASAYTVLSHQSA